MTAPLSEREEASIRRGAEAAALLESPAFVGAVAAVARDMAEKARTAKGAEEAWQHILQSRALEAVLGQLRATISAGRYAEAQRAGQEEDASQAQSLVEGREDYLRRANAARSHFMEGLRAAATASASQEDAAELSSTLPEGGEHGAG